MRKSAYRRALLGISGVALAACLGCATPAVVFVSPDYASQHIQRVALLGFDDLPGQPGSGSMVADIFEKYLLTGPYQLVERNEADQVLAQLDARDFEARVKQGEAAVAVATVTTHIAASSFTASGLAFAEDGIKKGWVESIPGSPLPVVRSGEYPAKYYRGPTAVIQITPWLIAYNTDRIALVLNRADTRVGITQPAREEP